MRLPWQHKDKTVYVPVPSYGSYESKWENKIYLRALDNVAGSEPWIVEVTQLIKEIRDLADNAQSVEMLKAYNSCIGLAKMRLVVSGYAKDRIVDIDAKAAALEGLE